MEASAIQHIPAIIEQAAKSPLGLFALMVIALSVLGFVFFRTSSERTRVAMFVMLFVGVASFGVATFRSVPFATPEPAIEMPLADIDGEWQAEITYDWGDAYREVFAFTYGDGEVLGSASFLGTKRALFEGRLEGNLLRFVVKTQENLGGDGGVRDVTHHYTGKAVGERIEFVMRTEGGFSAHAPIEFIATRTRAN